MDNRNKKKIGKVFLVGATLSALLAVPLVSSASMGGGIFGVKAVNTEDSKISAVRGLQGNATEPSPEPTQEPPAKDYLTQFTINTAQTNCDPSTFTLQLPGTGGSGTIDWGDGSEKTALKGYANTHNYSTPGTYQLKIDGTYSGIRQGDLGNNAKKSNSCIQSFDHMGEDTGVTTLTGLFRDTSSLQSVAKLPSSVTDVSSMFYRASNITADLSKLDVSHVQNFSSMFTQAVGSSFPGIDKWNTGSATNMSQMFGQATTFDQDISNWNVSNVSNFSSMFGSAIAFDKPLNSWNMSSATNISSMFQAASKFNQPLGNWGSKLGSVTNASAMFKQAVAFDQNINSWDVSKVTNFGNMFSGASVYNQPMSNWNTGSATNMYSMFWAASKFDQDISGWNVDGVYSNGPSYYEDFSGASLLQKAHKPVKFQ